MFTRRSAIGCTTAAFLTTPSILRAHTEDPFVLPEQFQPKEVRVREQYAAGMILVIPHQFYLYHIFETERAIRYGVGVGRAGLEFKGTAIIERKAKWPSWRPTNDMIRRDPDRYAKFAVALPLNPAHRALSGSGQNMGVVVGDLARAKVSSLRGGLPWTYGLQ